MNKELVADAAAAAARHARFGKLPERIRFEDMISEIKDEVKGLSIRWDSKGGISGNTQYFPKGYKAKDKTVEEILEERPVVNQGLS